MSESAVIKNTPCGQIEGRSENGVERFLGVRFAYAKRFEMPKKVEWWQGVLDASHYAPCCVQYRTYHDESLKKNTLWYDEFRRGLQFEYSEDCLNLNIYAPAESKDCPVIVYVHGGSFVKGSNNERAFDGSEYAKRGVVCVFVNYRLNIFGYYADKNTHNLALEDILCAVDWVKSNVTAFGGDPENVTLMGQSAGAMSLQALILSSRLKDEVKGAILLSGGGLTKGLYAPHCKIRAERFSAAVAKQLETEGEDVKTADTAKLFGAYEKTSKKHPVTSLLAMMPVFDGKLVKKSAYKNLENCKLPCIIGITKDDLQPRKYLVQSAKSFARHSGAPVWNLDFNRDLPGDDNGAWHSCDLWYVFGTLNIHPYRKFEKRDFELSKEIIDRFVAFAKGQNPNAENLAKWAPDTHLVLK